MKRPRRARGFTLVELLSVMTILAILSAMAAPVMADMVVRYRIDGLRSELMQSIQQSRAEAMVRGNTVTLRRTAGCATALVDSNDWSCGWVAFVDMDADGQEEAGDTRLQVISLSPGTRLPEGDAMVFRSANDGNQYGVLFRWRRLAAHQESSASAAVQQVFAAADQVTDGLGQSGTGQVGVACPAGFTCHLSYLRP